MLPNHIVPVMSAIAVSPVTVCAASHASQTVRFNAPASGLRSAVARFGALPCTSSNPCNAQAGSLSCDSWHLAFMMEP